MPHIIINVDGGRRPTTGMYGSFRVFDADAEKCILATNRDAITVGEAMRLTHKSPARLERDRYDSSNVAAYVEMLRAMEYAWLHLAGDTVEFCTDSQLVVGQVVGFPDAESPQIRHKWAHRKDGLHLKPYTERCVTALDKAKGRWMIKQVSGELQKSILGH